MHVEHATSTYCHATHGEYLVRISASQFALESDQFLVEILDLLDTSILAMAKVHRLMDLSAKK